MAEYDVFISYSRKDSEIANRIYDALTAEGISCFIDREGISGGADFPTVLSEAIMGAKLLLLVASENSYASEFTQKELTFAVSNKGSRFIFPFIVDGSSLPKNLEFLLSNINWRSLSSRYTIEKEMVQDVKKKLANPHAGETIKQQEKNSAKILLIVFFVLLGIVGILGAGFLLKGNRENQKAEADRANCAAYMAQSGALIHRADSLRDSNTYAHQHFDEEVNCLASAETLLSQVDSIRRSYLNNSDWYFRFSEYETTSTRRIIQNKRDSMFVIWNQYALANYDDYLLFKDDVSREIALDYIHKALSLHPADQQLIELNNSINQ